MTVPDAAEPSPQSRYHRWHGHLHRNRAVAATTKIVVTLIGVLVIGAGVVMLVAPGPGLVAIVAGLAILATEYAWADRWLQSARRKLDEAKEVAMAMDPEVRRRRIILTFGGGLLAAGAAATYIAVRDWPGWSITLWNKAQSVFGFLPELPGM
ncbi:MAG: PGPGW domain-containing protein [Propionibacteriales bacterium]|nr:PGPGW domain-containing protein [Propionibacteriales bacterium]